jgi:hypothetical protein
VKVLTNGRQAIADIPTFSKYSALVPPTKEPTRQARESMPECEEAISMSLRRDVAVMAMASLLETPDSTLSDFVIPLRKERFWEHPG